MSRVRVTWRGDEWLRAALPHFNAGLTAAAAVGASYAASKMGTEGGGQLVGGKVINVKRGSKPVRAKGKARYVASPPGTYPGRRTGHLTRSVMSVSPERLGTPLHAAYGTATRYGRFLELGTRRMAPRPWVIRSARESQPAMREAFVARTKAGLVGSGLVEVRR